jgi:hypothetical protein
MTEKITGYRELEEWELQMINDIKDKAAEVGQMMLTLRNCKHLDQRWVSIATTDLQTGFMAAVRSIARPAPF